MNIKGYVAQEHLDSIWTNKIRVSGINYSHLPYSQEEYIENLKILYNLLKLIDFNFNTIDYIEEAVRYCDYRIFIAFNEVPNSIVLSKIKNIVSLAGGKFQQELTDFWIIFPT